MKLILCIAFCLFNSVKGCDETIEAESGTITSPNYPDNYPLDVDCTYTIIVPEGKTIQLTFTAFDIEDDGCDFDYITLNGGGRFCGDFAPNPFESDSNIMTVRFVSDDYFVKQGFSASFTSQTISAESSSTATASATNSSPTPTDSIASTDPSVPNSLPTSTDSIASTDSSVPNSSPTPTDSSVPNSSPTLTDSIVSNSSPTPVNAVAPTSSASTSCDETIEAESGIITSPNYPDEYPLNEDCTYTIIVPEGKTIQLTFTAFDIEDDGCDFDYITLNGGGRFCGVFAPNPFESDSNIMTVRFVSDDLVVKPGFSASFTSQTISAESSSTATASATNSSPTPTDSIVSTDSSVPNSSPTPTDSIVTTDSSVPNSSPTPTDSIVSTDSSVPNSSTTPTDSIVSYSSPTPVNAVAPTSSASTIANGPSSATAEPNSLTTPTDLTVSNSSPTTPLDSTGQTVPDSSPTLIPTESNDSSAPTNALVEATSTERVTTESGDSGRSSTRDASDVVSILLISVAVVAGQMW